jgi:hypothetical protein
MFLLFFIKILNRNLLNLMYNNVIKIIIFWKSIFNKNYILLIDIYFKFEI